MKKTNIFHKLNKSTTIKAIIVALLIVIFEVVAGILIYKHYASHTYEITFKGYKQSITTVANDISEDSGIDFTESDQTVLSQNVKNYLNGNTSFDYFVLFMQKRNGEVIGDEWAVSGSLASYGIDYKEVATVNVLDGNYVFAAEKIAGTDYYIGGFINFADRQATINSMLSNLIALILVESVLVLAAFIFYAYWAGGHTRMGRFEYKFTTDADGKIKSANGKFKKEYESVTEIDEDLKKFSRNTYNVLQLRGGSGEKLLIAKAAHLPNGKIKVYASGIKNASSLSGFDANADELTANGKAKASLSNAFEDFVKRGKRTLLGVLYISNLNSISALFGKEMALDIQKVIMKKAQEKFLYVYELDFAYIGMVYPDGKNLDNLLADMEDVMRYINQPVRMGDNLFTIDLKSGFALCDATIEHLTFEYAMRAAEAARSRAIETKIADYIIYHESQKKLYAKYFITYDIKQMLSEGAFEMEYQPQYNIAAGRIDGFEALFRVKKSWNVNVDTFSFITYAERTGAMVQLGDFIFSTGMQFAKRLEGKNISVSLNVSPVQLMQAGFTENFINMYKKYGLQPGSICVEITESFLMANYQEMIKKLQILKSNGISVHLDDFGTEYSSLLYIKNLPISTIKIDKEFVRDVVKSKESQAIISFITNIAKLLNFTTICEGVETMREYDTLKTLGCDTIQGWLISKSMKPDDALRFIDEFDLSKIKQN